MNNTLKKYLIRSIIVLFGLPVIYVLIYIILSLAGRYLPSTIENRGGEGYTWVPLGFSTAPRKSQFELVDWNTSMLYIFYPLWYVDVGYIHKSYGRLNVGQPTQP